jgi:hypothetical protein
LLAKPEKLRISSNLAQAHVIARKDTKEMLCNSNWLCLRLEQPTAIAIHHASAVNLAAFGGAFGSFVAAVRGIRNLNSLPR